jgi:hypothetical protein
MLYIILFILMSYCYYIEYNVPESYSYIELAELRELKRLKEKYPSVYERKELKRLQEKYPFDI